MNYVLFYFFILFLFFIGDALKNDPDLYSVLLNSNVNRKNKSDRSARPNPNTSAPIQDRGEEINIVERSNDNNLDEHQEDNNNEQKEIALRANGI